jgi:polyhydroxybutyrate depolymerase
LLVRAAVKKSERWVLFAPLTSLIFVVAACSGGGSAGSASVHAGADAQAPATTADDAGSGPTVDDQTDSDAGEPPISPLVLARPYTTYVPPGYDATKPTPLVLAFHGYGNGDSGKRLEAWFHLTRVADANTFLYITPDGTKDADGQQFWNGTDACCDFGGSGIDDVAYVRALIDDVSLHYNVDAKRIFVTGISGGGVFVHRLACDLSDRIAAAVSMSGTTWKDPTKCKPSSPIAVAEFHGDADDTVLYDGGSLEGVEYPSAHETVAHWAGYNGCTGALSPAGPMLDLESSVPGAETRVESYGSCARGSVELWTAQGGPHAPLLTTAWGDKLWSFFAAHPKP